jgi:hypothetical protein
MPLRMKPGMGLRWPEQPLFTALCSDNSEVASLDEELSSSELTVTSIGMSDPSPRTSWPIALGLTTSISRSSRSCRCCVRTWRAMEPKIGDHGTMSRPLGTNGSSAATASCLVPSKSVLSIVIAAGTEGGRGAMTPGKKRSCKAFLLKAS